MCSKLILFLSSILLIIVMVERIQNNIVFNFYFKYEVKENEVAEKLLFRDFLGKFNKSYGREELRMRYRNFKENLIKIEELNRGSRHATYGVTKFSDWSKEEWEGMLIPNVGNCEPRAKSCTSRADKDRETRKERERNYCCRKRRSRRATHNGVSRISNSWRDGYRKTWRDAIKCDKPCGRRLPPRKVEIPARLDWRKSHAVGPILDQKFCPACWAFSIIGVMEARAVIQNKGYNRLSIQHLLDCSFHNEAERTGCRNGRPIVQALMFLCMENMKIDTEANYPTSLLDERCPKTTAPGVRGIQSFVNSCEMHNNETKLLEVLSEGPVTALVNAQYLMNYNDGIIAENCVVSENELNHAVQIVGYDTTGELPYYIMKNSWGTTWGEGGYARLAIGRNQCGIAYSIGYFEVN